MKQNIFEEYKIMCHNLMNSDDNNKLAKNKLP